MNTTIKIPVVNKSTNDLPQYAHSSDAGFDFRANIRGIENDKFLFNSTLNIEDNTLIINPGGRALVPTGLHMAIPEGYELQVRPRSGLALKFGISVLNTPGTIDSGYIGDIGIIVINHGDKPFMVYQGDKIAQGVFSKIETVTFEKINTLEETSRGEGGFGHTGI